MERSSQDPNFKELELYTIPSYSSWFSWNDIHQIERYSLKEFFDGSSITRTPKIYKEYRDFIISKYREEPTRRLTFTEVRKSLVGDLSLIHKVFLFLQTWNLINFSAPKPEGDDDLVGEEGKWKIRVEEGAPHGVKVVAVPNSSKPISAPPELSNAAENGFKLPPLASYSDMYNELMQQKKLVCGNCSGPCDLGYYEYAKEKSFIICVKCFKDEKFGEGKSVDDFKFNDSGNLEWTEAETLLLLESVLKHGDDWELVSQNVKTKTKLECISKLLLLPFGQLMLRPAYHGKITTCGPNGSVSIVKQPELDSTESQETTTTTNQLHELKNESQQNGDAEDLCPPQKKLCIEPISDATNSLMKQVARISTMVGSHITSSASEAAVAALCYEYLVPREIFEGNDNNGTHEFGSPPQSNEIERASLAKDSEMEERHTSDFQETSSMKNDMPPTLRVRASTATALGAAAAHAKLLADQEDREIEHLVATIIEMQVKKLQCKMRFIGDLELIMEKEYTQMEELEESLLSERINLLQKMTSAGISRWRDHSSVTTQVGSVL